MTAATVYFAKKARAGVHGHHSYPKYLGGDPKQKLTPLDAKRHEQLHAEMDKIAPRSKGKAYYDALPPAEKGRILKRLEDLYRSSHPDVLDDCLKTIGLK